MNFELEENIKPKTLAEMEELAKQLFGRNARVSFSDDKWVIETGVYERLDLTEFEGTAALEAYNTSEASYGSELERWMHKNGHGYESVAQGMRLYNEEMEWRVRNDIKNIRAHIAAGRPFDWEGGQEWADKLLKLAEEKGW